MSKWKDVPNLFANGKFDIQLKGMIDKRKDWTVNNKLKIMWWCYACGSQGEWIIEDLNKCTLIARPISDMSDEELSDCEGLWHDMVYYHDDEYCISAKDAIEINCEAGVFDTIIHLLNIGVYPFDQSHFENDDLEVRYELG